MKTAVGLREAVAVVGLGLLVVGLVMVYVPAALIVSGFLLFGLAVWPLLRGGGD